jgi:replicative DNA helicase
MVAMRDDFSSRTPLTDQALEGALIALIFADNANIDRIGKLEPDDLSDPVMGAALAGAMDMRAEGCPISLITLRARMQGIPVDDRRTGLDVLRSLSMDETLPSVADIAARLRGLADRRRLVDDCRRLADAAADESQPLPVLYADAARQFTDRVSENISDAKTSFTLQAGASEFIAWLQSNQEPIEISTGLTDLDNATGGHHRGETTILAGRPSMGKSAIAIASSIRTALKGNGVLYFSLEMTKRQVMARALADFAYTNPAIAYSDLRPGRSDRYVHRLRAAAERFNGLPMEVETKGGMTVAEIQARAAKAAEKFKEAGTPLGLIVVDHLLKIKPSSRYAGQPVKEIDEISDAMCVMAKTMNVAVLALHQLNRAVEARDNQRPVMSDLRQSGSLEQDADVVLFVYRPAYQFERQRQEGKEAAAEAETKLQIVKNKLEIQIAKQRSGPTQTLEFWVDMASNVVRDKDWRGGR